MEIIDLRALPDFDKVALQFLQIWMGGVKKRVRSDRTFASLESHTITEKDVPPYRNTVAEAIVEIQENAEKLITVIDASTMRACDHGSPKALHRVVHKHNGVGESVRVHTKTGDDYLKNFKSRNDWDLFVEKISYILRSRPSTALLEPGPKDYDWVLPRNSDLVREKFAAGLERRRCEGPNAVHVYDIRTDFENGVDRFLADIVLNVARLEPGSAGYNIGHVYTAVPNGMSLDVFMMEVFDDVRGRLDVALENFSKRSNDGWEKSVIEYKRNAKKAEEKRKSTKTIDEARRKMTEASEKMLKEATEICVANNIPVEVARWIMFEGGHNASRAVHELNILVNNFHSRKIVKAECTLEQQENFEGTLALNNVLKT